MKVERKRFTTEFAENAEEERKKRRGHGSRWVDVESKPAPF